VDVVSPELALVDPELAARARAAIPFPGDCLAPSAPLGAGRSAPVLEAVPRPRRPSLLVALAALLAASLIGVPAGATAGVRTAAGAVAHALQQASASAMP
jgi:hypothetical protein